MRFLRLAMVLLGLSLAGSGVYLAQAYMARTQAILAQVQAQQAQSAELATVPVLVAARALRYGEPIMPEAVRVVPWPAAALPPGAFTESEALFADPNRPRVALRAIEPGEPILQIKVSEPGQPAGIAAILTPGMRAFTIRVDAASGISGTLRPGNMVDLYWTGRGPDGEVTRLIASAVRIVALDENADQDREVTGIPRTVTIEAPPELVATIAQAQATGRLSMALVGLDDERALSAIEVDRRRLLGLAAESPPPPAEHCTIRTRRGAEVVTVEIPCSN